MEYDSAKERKRKRKRSGEEDEEEREGGWREGGREETINNL